MSILLRNKFAVPEPSLGLGLLTLGLLGTGASIKRTAKYKH